MSLYKLMELITLPLMKSITLESEKIYVDQSVLIFLTNGLAIVIYYFPYI